jgi:hypothetical protein
VVPVESLPDLFNARVEMIISEDPQTGGLIIENRIPPSTRYAVDRGMVFMSGADGAVTKSTRDKDSIVTLTAETTTLGPNLIIVIGPTESLASGSAGAKLKRTKSGRGLVLLAGEALVLLSAGGTERVSGEELVLHTGVTGEDVRQLLGRPGRELAGLPRVSGKALQELTEMGMRSMLYESRGVEIILKDNRVWNVTVRVPFKGIFHDARLGAPIKEIATRRGNPWQWRGERMAIYRLTGASRVLLIFDLDEKGHVTQITEEDRDIRGDWEILPSF